MPLLLCEPVGSITNGNSPLYYFSNHRGKSLPCRTRRASTMLRSGRQRLSKTTFAESNIAEIGRGTMDTVLYILYGTLSQLLPHKSMQRPHSLGHKTAFDIYRHILLIACREVQNRIAANIKGSRKGILLGKKTALAQHCRFVSHLLFR